MVEGRGVVAVLAVQHHRHRQVAVPPGRVGDGPAAADAEPGPGDERAADDAARRDLGHRAVHPVAEAALEPRAPGSRPCRTPTAPAARADRDDTRPGQDAAAGQPRAAGGSGGAHRASLPTREVTGLSRRPFRA